MIDVLEYIDELKELQKLYNEGELRNFDFEAKIQQHERKVEQFELEAEGFYGS